MSPTPTNPAIMQIAKAASGASSSVFVPVSKALGSTISCSLVAGGLSSTQAAAVASAVTVSTQTGGCGVSWANSAFSAGSKAPVTLRVSSGSTYTETDFILEVSNANPGSPPSTVITYNGGQTVAQGTTLNFAVGSTYTVTFTSTDPDAGAIIRAQLVGSIPSGATLTGLGPLASPLVSTFTWTPTTPNLNGNVQLLISDETNKQVTASFSYVVPADNVKPVVTVPASITEEANTLGGRIVTYEDYSPALSATDNIDGAVAVTCNPLSGAKFSVGSTPVTCTATDASYNEGTGSFTVTITDNVAPLLTLPSNMVVPADGPSGSAVTFSATALDAVEGPVTANCNPISGSTFPIASTPVVCTASDSSRNTVTNSFTVTVVDNAAPVVSVPADMTVSALNSAGSVVTFSASATDNIDGSKPVTCVPSSGSTFPLGPTRVACSATDVAGNVGTSFFTVTVVDDTKPVVTVPSNMVEEASSSAGKVVTFSVTASDNVDGAVTPTCVPASGSTFPLGATPVTCSANDRAGNTATASFTVTVTDVTPPTFPNGAPAGMTVEALSASGAPATITAPAAADTVDATPTVVCERKGDGKALTDLFPLGATVVTCTATDDYNNQASVQFTMTVVDTTRPVLGVPAPNVLVDATSEFGAPVTYTVTVTDAVTTNIFPTCTPASGSTFGFGSTTVTCTATDAAGNTGTASFMVTVTACAFGGFLPPVENPPQVNLVSTQQNLPLKWSLAGYWGMNILAPGYPRLVAVNCGTFADPDAPTDVPADATVTTALKYDTTEGRYMLGYSLKGRTVINTCYQLQLQFTTCPGRTFLALVKAVRNK